ncbi:hypothetical protein [Antarcticirhabdus aurantiaca]|uniref:Uncharacterized protein n=1 Tax=Antarcticirhabdus aurantiaca TaxID=2606717 RepID=A0ACD4NHM4_9HYPH|nr:hypothetical protein OXU80_15315 [Jeongeuplla avenae]
MSTEQLVVALEARIRDFERNFQKASGTANQHFGQIERRAKDAGKRMEESLSSSSSRINATLSNIGKGGLAALAGAATIGGLTALVGRLAAVAEGVANIGSEAKRAGVSTRVFQEWSHVAAQTRIPIDALIDGFKELSIRADEFAVTGKGSGEEAFKRLGFTASDLARRLKEPETLILEIIRRMEGLNKAAQIRVADEIFGGTGGERFVELLSQGEAGIRQMIAEANNLGLVMSDELIAKADEIDKRFKLIAGTVGTELKRAVIETVDVLSTFFDGFRDFQNQQDDTLKQRLGDIFTQRQELQDTLADLEKGEAAQSGFDIFGADYAGQIATTKEEIARLTDEAMRLKDILDRRNGYSEGFVFKIGDEATGAKPPVDNLATSVAAIDGAGATAAGGIKTFSDALRALKEEIPGLTDQLAELDAKTRIETAYQAALGKARSIGDTLVAEKLRDEALAALSSKPAREAANGGMLDLIGYAEGTDKGRGYNETLAYGKFAGGPRNLVTMTLDEVDAMQSQMLRHPDNHFNSSASGRYQIVQKTLRGLRKSLGLTGSELFDPAMQDRLASELLRQRGNDPAGLRNEWEGLRRIDAETIRSAYDGTSVAMPAIDPGVQSNREARVEEARSQTEAYGQIMAEAQRFRSEMSLEQSALGMTAQAAARLRYEQEMLAEAQRAGIELSPQQRAEISSVAASMAQAEAAAVSLANSQEQAAEIAAQFQGIANGAVKGLASDLMAGKDAGEAFANMLSRIADQLVQMAVDQLFANAFAPPKAGASGAAGGTGGALSGIFSAIGSFFGFSKGGIVQAFATGGHVRGAGTSTSDSIPARLSNGEFVVNAAATRENRALLEAINRGGVPSLAAGRPVGGSSSSSSVTNNFAPTISVQVEGGATGNRQDDEAFAGQIAARMNEAMEIRMTEFMQNQMRPGNALAGGRRR